MAKEKVRGKKAGGVFSFLVYLFLYMPIIVLVVFSFNNSKLNAVWNGFTFKWYKSLFSNFGILEAVKNSLIVAFCSTIVATFIGTVTAYGMYKYASKGTKLLDSLLYIPIVIPEIVMGISLLAFFSELHFSLGLISLIIAHITFSISYVVIVVKARLDGFDKALEEAAMDLGATPVVTFFKVILPVIAPGVVAGALLAFTLSLDDVIISFFVAGTGSTTLPLKVFSMVKFGVTPEINALSSILMVFTISIVILTEILKSNAVKNKAVKVGARIFGGVLLVALISLFVVVSGSSKNRTVLNVFNWSEYLPDSVIQKFEDKYNVKVNYSTFSSNEEMLAKMMAGGSQYDLVVSSDYMVPVLAQQKIIKPIDLNKIYNFKNIGDEFKNLPFDEGNKYSVPYMSSDVAIAINTAKVKTDVTGYADLWKPEFKNSVVVLDDERMIIGAALKKLGYSINDTNPAHLNEAKAELEKLKPNIKSFDSDSPKTLLINGEATAGIVWGTEVSLAKKENKNIKVVIPKDGLSLQQDNFVVPTGSKNLKNVYKFINFIYEPEISAEISKTFPYENPNVAARKYIPQSTLDDQAIYPPSAAKKGAEYLKDIGQNIKIFDNIWTQIKQ